MEENWKFKTNSVIIKQGHYYVNKVIFINLDIYKKLELKYLEGEPEVSIKIYFKNKFGNRIKLLRLDLNECIYIKDINCLEKNTKAEIKKSIRDVEQWVAPLEGKVYQIFDSVKYVRYIADLMRANRVIIVPTKLIKEYENDENI